MVVVVLAGTLVVEVEVGLVEEEEVVEADGLLEQAANAAPATVPPATWRNLRRPNAPESLRGSAIGPHAKGDLRHSAAIPIEYAEERGTDAGMWQSFIVSYVSTSADEVASALATDCVHLIAAIPDGWVRREKGMVAGVTGVAVPTLNGVWPEQVELDRVVVSEFLDQVASSGVPYCLQLRPGASEKLSALAADRGMVKRDQIPLMVLEDGGELQSGPEGSRPCDKAVAAGRGCAARDGCRTRIRSPRSAVRPADDPLE